MGNQSCNLTLNNGSLILKKIKGEVDILFEFSLIFLRFLNRNKMVTPIDKEMVVGIGYILDGDDGVRLLIKTLETDSEFKEDVAKYPKLHTLIWNSNNNAVNLASVACAINAN